MHLLSSPDVKQKKKKKRVFAKSKAIEEGTLSEDTASTSEIKELEELLKLKERQLLTQVSQGNDTLGCLPFPSFTFTMT